MVDGCQWSEGAHSRPGWDARHFFTHLPSAGPVSPTSVTRSLHRALQDGIHHCIDMLLRCDGMGRILNRGVGLNTDCGTLQCIDCGTLTAEQDGQNIEQGGRTQD